jgi:protease PrsW
MLQLVLFLGIGPALLAIWLVDRSDHKRPEPPKLLRKLTIAGALSVIPVIGIELLLDHVGPQKGYEHALWTAFIVAAGTEELAKVACLRWFAWNRPEFDERMDGIIYAARAGLGFAGVENVFYVLGASQEGLGSLLLVSGLRAVLSVPGHAIFAGLMGYCAARRRFDGKGPGQLGGYLIAVALHGAFDGGIFVGLVIVTGGNDAGYALFAVPILVVLFGFLALRTLARRAVAADDADPRHAVGVPAPAAPL